MRGGSAVAAMSTGPRNRNTNGFSTPPVSDSSRASWTMSNANSQAARSGSSRSIGRKRSRRARLRAALQPITSRQAVSGSVKSNT